jgi:cystathionine beta-lyase/cystathionine gamma-synthase
VGRGVRATQHRELEAGLAQLKGTPECLLFPSGFSANIAVIAALCARGLGCTPHVEEAAVAIFSDALNHASIVDGSRLARAASGAQLHVYRCVRPNPNPNPNPNPEKDFIITLNTWVCFKRTFSIFFF